MVVGALLLLTAVSLFLFNQCEASQAEQATDVLLPELKDLISARQETLQTTEPDQPDTPSNPPTGTDTPAETEQGSEGEGVQNEVPITPPDVYDPIDVEMAEVELDGHFYIGYLAIPDLGLELPIMTDWSYPQLKIAPCRYMGTVKGNDLVLLAHNYNKHFGKLKNLTTGALVTFTDVDGETTQYEVVSLVTLQPTDVEKVTTNDYDLTLFTCTYGGRTRVTVYCDRIEP